MIVLLLLQFSSCAFMTGLIWTIQVLHYPAFTYISEEVFPKFHAFHSRAITYIVLPIMSLELATALALAFFYSTSWILLMNALGVLLIWLGTFILSVPLHNLLAKRNDLKRIEKLILTNWVRTILWSARLGLLLYYFFKIMADQIK